jgi:hypothetical protein
MWALFILFVVHAFAQDANVDQNAKVGEADLGTNPLDQELAQMSKELDSQPVQPVKAAMPKKAPAKEEQISDSPNIDVNRYVELEPNEQIALVQYNVPAQIISTRPGDKVAIVPVGGKKTTPCPSTTTKNPHPHMYCQSCGKVNPKERGLITSYIDVSNSRECASLCARYLAKGNRCDVWEYHGEWRNKQCFLLYIPDFKKCQGDIGLLGEMSFESGTCESEEVSQDTGIDETLEMGEVDEVGADTGLPLFPRMEKGVGSILGSHPTWKLAIGALFVMLVGVAFYQRSKSPTGGYMELLDNREEV